MGGVLQPIEGNSIDKQYFNLLRQITYYHDGWSKKHRRNVGRKAIAFGLVNDMAEFSRMFPIRKLKKTKSPKNKNEHVKSPVIVLPEIKYQVPQIDYAKIEKFKKWIIWYEKSSGETVLKGILSRVDIDSCLNNNGYISNTKTMRTYLKKIMEQSDYLCDIWIEYANAFLSQLYAQGQLKSVLVIDKNTLSKIDLKQYMERDFSSWWAKLLNEYLDYELNAGKRQRKSRYGEHSQITRKPWGSAFKPARG